MVLKRVIGLVFAGALAFSAMAADIVVRIAPPRMVVERRGPPPSRNHVWSSGISQLGWQHYVWVQGRWEQPPRARARWVAHHWVHRNGGYVLVEGHWQLGPLHGRLHMPADGAAGMWPSEAGQTEAAGRQQ